jgi:arylformamidase
MIIELVLSGKKYQANTSQPLDIALPIRNGSENPNCYWADDVRMEVITSGSFVGSVSQGGSVNYQKLTLTPHGNGTHTECYGHLSADGATIQQCLKSFMFPAVVVTATPEARSGDHVITLSAIKEAVDSFPARALVIRTLPNDDTKRTRKYSNTNPPYLSPDLMEYLVSRGYEHLLVDLPSVDREVDGGALLAHRAFWQYPTATRTHCTITELVYVPGSVPDGPYLLNLQVISLEMDASPSKPILYKLTEVF